MKKSMLSIVITFLLLISIIPLGTIAVNAVDTGDTASEIDQDQSCNTVSDGSVIPDADEPEYNNDLEEIYFNVKSTGWNKAETIYCHVWRFDNTGKWPAYMSKAEKCTYNKDTGIAAYKLSQTGNSINKKDGNLYGVIFASNKGEQTYTAVMNGKCMGDTLYATGNKFQSPSDSQITVLETAWRKNTDCGALKFISYTGKVCGTAHPEGESDTKMLAQYLIDSYDNEYKLSHTQSLLNQLYLSPIDVLEEVFDILSENEITDSEMEIIQSILYTLSECADPTMQVKVSRKTLKLGAGEKFKLDAVVCDDKYGIERDADDFITWKSENTAIAVVDANGVVTAKKPGNVFIRAMYEGGSYDDCSLTVMAAPSSVKLSQTSIILGKGESIEISETTNSGSYANAINLSWENSNKSVANVSKTSGNKAKITAKATGTTNVSIKLYNGKTATCKVTVKPEPTSVKANPISVTLGTGETYTVSESTNSGSYANAVSLKWSSSNTSVASVAKGNANKAVITAKKPGTANITIKLYNGKTAVCKVTVKPEPTSVKTNPISVTLGAGETYTISESTNSGSYANAVSLKWSSSNTNVVSVTKGNANKAVITAKKPGTADIKIKLYNGKTASCKVTVKSAPASVKLSKTSITLKKGQSYTLSESTDNGSYAKSFAWSSSNKAVATVTKGNANKAVVKAVKTGTANITIKTYNGKTATCKVTVK